MKKKIHLSFIDRVSIFLHIYPDKPEVREWLNRQAEERLAKQQTKGLIQSSNAISKVR